MLVVIDTSDFRRYRQELKRFGVAHAHGVRNALNGCAFEAQKAWRDEVANSFTLRSSFTERSIQVDKARGISVSAMRAVVGSTAPYMGDQEVGAEVRGKGRHKPIPAPVAGGGSGSGVRPRKVAGRYLLSKIKVANPLVGRFGRKQRNAIAMATAVATGNRFALLSRVRGGKGLFEVKRLGPRRFGLRLIWDVSRSAVHVKPEPTMHRAIDHSMSAFERITKQALIDQLKRDKVMGF